MSREEYIDKHEYKIWLASDGYWKTHLPDDTKPHGRKPLKKKNKEDLLNAIASYYKQKETKPTIQAVFEMWSKRKLETGAIKKQTFDRYESDFGRFFLQNKISPRFHKRLVHTITADELEEFLLKTINEEKITRKTFAGLRLIVRGTFLYAKKHSMTTLDIIQFFEELELPKSLFVRKKRKNREEAYTVEEAKRIVTFLSYRDKDLASLGLLLTFLSGVRIGELSALKLSDIRHRGKIIINNTEIKVKNKDGLSTLEVQPLPKSEAGEREIILPEIAEKVIGKILDEREPGEFLFMRNGKRMRSNKFRYRLEATCKHLGIKYLPNHKIRKTYGTALCNSQIGDALIATQMGHEDATITKKIYYIDTATENEKREAIETALPWI